MTNKIVIGLILAAIALTVFIAIRYYNPPPAEICVDNACHPLRY